MLRMDELRALAGAGSSPSVSIFMPTHVAGREIRQDPVRLRQLVDAAADRLTRLGMRRAEADRMLQPALDSVEDSEFWRHQDQGLALFLAPGFFRSHQVPLELEEQVVVGPRFVVRPLLPLAGAAGRFFVLALSSARARVFEATAHSIRERHDLRLPAGVAEVAAATAYQSTGPGNPAPGTRPGTAGRNAEIRNLGEDSGEEYKTQILDYLHQTKAVLEERLRGDRTPVVLAAQPEMHGNFLAVAELPSLVPDVVEVNPDALDPAELQRRALAVARPVLEAGRRDALNQFRELLGAQSARASAEPKTIVKAARHGRIDTLFVADRGHLWGRFDEAADQVTTHESAEAGDEELVNYAAVQALLNGGRVEAARLEELHGKIMGALLRY
jgi:hypothetical protein